MEKLKSFCFNTQTSEVNKTPGNNEIKGETQTLIVIIHIYCY